MLRYDALRAQYGDRIPRSAKRKIREAAYQPERTAYQAEQEAARLAREGGGAE